MTGQSNFIEKSGYLSRYTHERTVAIREAQTFEALREREEEWLDWIRKQLPRFIPFLIRKCGVDFRGRILEIGAGGAWLSAELSKLPRVVEIIATDYSPKLLKEEAPKVFKTLGANVSKITRMPADFHHLDFADNHFDLVVSSEALRDAANIVQVLREVKRVLKPGGRFVAIREPVWPLVKLKSRSKMVQHLVATGINERFYTLSNYKEFFKQAGMPVEIKRVNTSTGFKYFVNAVVNGLTHARYAFIGRKKSEPAAVYGGKGSVQPGLPRFRSRDQRPLKVRER